MSGRDESPEIVKWYTRARKFPQLIGKTPDGAKLWGGPYTYTQVVGASVVLVVGLKTISLWGSFGLVGNALVVLGRRVRHRPPARPAAPRFPQSDLGWLRDPACPQQARPRRPRR